MRVQYVGQTSPTPISEGFLRRGRRNLGDGVPYPNPVALNVYGYFREKNEAIAEMVQDMEEQVLSNLVYLHGPLQ